MRRAMPVLPAGVVAVLAAGLIGLLYFGAVRTVPGQRIDALGTHGNAWLENYLGTQAMEVASRVSVVLIAVVTALAGAIALLRRRPMVAAGLAVLVGGANCTTYVLKHVLLARPDMDVTWPLDNSLPSGHVTAAASLACALTLAVGPRWRPVAAVAGGGYACAMGLSVVIMGWHRPADVVAALLVVCAWTALVVVMGAAYRTARHGLAQPAIHPWPAPYKLTAVVLAAAGGIGTVTAVVGATSLAHLTGPATDPALWHQARGAALALAAGGVGAMAAIMACLCLVLVPPSMALVGLGHAPHAQPPGQMG